MGSRDGFQINEQGMREMERTLQMRFNKMNLTVPVGTDLGSNNVFITGDSTQVVVGGNNGTMAQGDVQVPAEYEGLAIAVREMRETLRSLLDPEDLADVESSVHDALTEMTQSTPDRQVLRRALVTIKGYAVPFMVTAGQDGGHHTASALAHLVQQLNLP